MRLAGAADQGGVAVVQRTHRHDDGDVAVVERGTRLAQLLPGASDDGPGGGSGDGPGDGRAHEVSFPVTVAASVPSWRRTRTASPTATSLAARTSFWPAASQTSA